MATTLRCSSVKEILNYEWEVSHERTGPCCKEAVCEATGSKILFYFFHCKCVFYDNLDITQHRNIGQFGAF